MLVIKAKDCEYLGFECGFHKIRHLKYGSIEYVKEFKMILDKDNVEYYMPDGFHVPTIATLRAKLNAN